MKRPNCFLISHNKAAMIGDTPALLQGLGYTYSFAQQMCGSIILLTIPTLACLLHATLSRTQAVLFKGMKCTLGNGAEVRVFKSISVGDTLIRRTSVRPTTSFLSSAAA